MVKKILITGAGGRIGAALRAGLKGRYETIRLVDLQPIEDLEEGEEAVQADICDLQAVEDMIKGMDGVVHLAASVSARGWETMFEPNFIGTYNIFEAARRQGVRRIVYASSIHAHGFYRREQKVAPDSPPRPDSIYGVSKVFGEALGRFYADKHGMEVVGLRIASFQPKPTTVRHLGTWLSPRDCVELVDCSLQAKGIHFEVVYGVSANSRELYTDPNRANIGYIPLDNAEDYAAEILAAMKPEDEPEMERAFHGALYVPVGFSGDLSKIS
ncbi:NAD(P)-dependent oxidoreductase [Aquamicrobium lusatiense]|uniref:NAD-dependent epimerase/dehydratase family protein n=1 Tax=Aquamicrobium lusatiense TaxID=89772 RepID=UPI0024571712|nr:NAD(P)-dependent oxidoreductase [Aquamicrobium lusatiense]MDH4989419.1 NAD(P)-dependent oxidoreductase [Aquamicrobium lusatiense]